MIDVGYKNFIEESMIKEITDLSSARSRWNRKEAIAGNTLIDCTQGRKTRSIIIMKSGHVVLSSLKSISLKKRKNTTEKESGNKSEKPINQQLLEAIDNSVKK